MNNKDIKNVYENFTSIKAPPPILESLHKVITELYEITLIADEIECEELTEEYPDPQTLDEYYDTVDGMLSQERYEDMMADYWLNREKDEGTEY